MNNVKQKNAEIVGHIISKDEPTKLKGGSQQKDVDEKETKTKPAGGPGENSDESIMSEEKITSSEDETTTNEFKPGRRISPGETRSDTPLWLALEIINLVEKQMVALPPDVWCHMNFVQEIYLQNNYLNILAPGIFRSGLTAQFPPHSFFPHFPQSD